MKKKMTKAVPASKTTKVKAPASMMNKGAKKK
jgi:hypothetical protein